MNMRKLCRHVLHALLAAGACASALAADVATDPVGYVNIDIAASGYTFIGLPLCNAVSYTGPVDTVAGAVVSFSGTPFTDASMNAATIGAEQVPQYFLEVASGTDTGAMISIIGNTASALTLNEDVSSFISAGTTVKVRPLFTLNSLFPSGAPLQGGTSAASADTVTIFDAQTQTSKSYFFHSLSSQWRQGTTNNGQRSILPNQSIYINRKGSTGATLVVTGAVKTGTTAIDILTGYNLIPNPYPVPYTFSLSQLYTGDANTGLKSGTTASNADTVLIYNSSGVPTTYYYHSLTNQWRTGTTPASDVQIPVGGAIMINRKTAPFSWVKSQPY